METCPDCGSTVRYRLGSSGKGWECPQGHQGSYLPAPETAEPAPSETPGLPVMDFTGEYTDAEMRALVLPAFGLPAGDDAEITIIVEKTSGDQVRGAAWSTTGVIAAVRRAAQLLEGDDT